MTRRRPPSYYVRRDLNNITLHAAYRGRARLSWSGMLIVVELANRGRAFVHDCRTAFGHV